MVRGVAVSQAMLDYTKTTALGRPADPEEVAKVIVFLLGEDASFVTGAVYSIDAGLTA
jgi:NAD(P)-dependent dehydrogenase (short-subunit alcohol dehydrogenase family)